MKEMTDKKYAVYYNEKSNNHEHCTVGWLYFVGLEYKKPVLFTDDTNTLRKICKKLNEELKN